MRMIRSSKIAILLALSLGLAGQSAPVTAKSALGEEPKSLSRSSALKDGNGAIILSIRSELFLFFKLDIYFLREGGDPTNDADIVRFSRSQPDLAFSNATTKYKVRAMQLPEGRYQLRGYGSKCAKIPAPEERCLVDVKILGIGETIHSPSRGYDETAPVFEVREGTVTVLGDFGLTGRNTLEWSPIPPEKLEKITRKVADLPRSPDFEAPPEFHLKYKMRPRSAGDDRGRRY